METSYPARISAESGDWDSKRTLHINGRFSQDHHPQTPDLQSDWGVKEARTNSNFSMKAAKVQQEEIVTRQPSSGPIHEDLEENEDQEYGNGGDSRFPCPICGRKFNAEDRLVSYE